MVKEIKKEQFENNVLQSDGCSIVDFYATWCHPCQMLAPVMEAVSEEKDDINFFKIDVDQAQDLAIKYEVEYIPTVIIFKQGKEIGRINGMDDKAGIIQQIEELV